jgi:NCS1 family nucleobase:cation symporter-1
VCTFLSFSDADLSRYAKSQKAQVLGQCIGFPLTNVLVPAIGMLVAGAAKVLYKKDLWDLISLFGEWNGWVSFFSSMLLLTSVVIINCAANIISPANDFANLSDILTRCGLPRISFRHGALLSLFLAVLLQPWRTFSSADSFLSSFLVGYSSVTGAILGIMVCDFYALRRCELDVPQLYSIETDGPYYFFHGFNLRASAAMAIGIAPCIPGFLAQLGGPDVSEGWKQVYAVSWFVAFAVSFVAYGVASVAFPARITQRNEDEDHWDHQAGGVQPLR